MRTVLKAAVAAAVLFAVVLWLTFPTDQLVRRALERVPVPDGHVITFQHARLRPWGLVLDDAAYRRSDGQPVIETDWVRIRPSWTSFWRDRLGRPWHVAAGVFGGETDARIDVDGGRRNIDVTWTDIDVGSLLDAVQRDDPLTGRSTGHALLRLPSTDPASGEGELTLRGATWQPPVEALEDVPLHADTAMLRWSLGDRRLQLSSLDVRGEEVDLTAQGQVRLAQALGASALDLRFTIAPLPGAPLELRRLLDGLPRRPDGVRDFRLTGTLNAPRIAPP
jgi:type II secretion system protein N